jgi:hypothetical protein
MPLSTHYERARCPGVGNASYETHTLLTSWIQAGLTAAAGDLAEFHMEAHALALDGPQYLHLGQALLGL